MGENIGKFLCLKVLFAGVLSNCIDFCRKMTAVGQRLRLKKDKRRVQIMKKIMKKSASKKAEKYSQRLHPLTLYHKSKKISLLFLKYLQVCLYFFFHLCYNVIWDIISAKIYVLKYIFPILCRFV